MNPIHTVYTIGYGKLKLEDLITIRRQLGAVIVDVRLSPRSRNPQYRQDHLKKSLGDWYFHLDAFGNENYQSGPIKLKDPDSGVEKVKAMLTQFPVILMCVCSDVEHCHRKVAADLLAERLGVKVEHITNSGVYLPAPDPVIKQKSLF